jgi:anti-sigma factor RsiW
MNDEHFFNLAMKAIARHATDAERAELEALLAREPELKAEFERLQADVCTAKEALPIVEAAQATAAELPAYARGRLQTKVRETLGQAKTEKESDRSLAWGWRWVLGLATTAAVVLLVALPMFRTPSAPVIQLAMLDTTGGTRGAGTNDVALLQATWKGTPVQTFSSLGELETWQKNWPTKAKQNIAKIAYDPAAGEVKVSGYSKEKFFQRTFPLEQDLATTLRNADAFLREQRY